MPLFGVELSEGAEALLHEVEAHYQKRISERVNHTWEAARRGRACVERDGTPVIEINSTTGRAEATIVHELLHLKLDADGFANCSFPDGYIIPNTRVDLRWLHQDIRDPIQHHIFFPTLRAYGLDPDAQTRADFQQAIQNGSFEDNRTGPIRALRLFKAYMEIVDCQLLGEIEAWYEANNWNQELTTAKQLQRVVNEIIPTNPEEELLAFVSCVNLFVPAAALAVVELAWLQQGSHRQRVAVIRTGIKPQE